MLGLDMPLQSGLFGSTVFTLMTLKIPPVFMHRLNMTQQFALTREPIVAEMTQDVSDLLMNLLDMSCQSADIVGGETALVTLVFSFSLVDGSNVGFEGSVGGGGEIAQVTPVVFDLFMDSLFVNLKRNAFRNCLFHE